MPRTSPRLTSSDRNDGDSDSESKQLVFIVPDKVLKDKSDGNTTFVELRHPKTDEETLFVFDAANKVICEILKYEEKPRSWFLGNSVEQDGSLNVCTEINVLFLVLPYFMKLDKFVLLDQVFNDHEFPQARKLVKFVSLAQLDFITDCKDHGDEVVYRFNKEKTLDWLKKRTEKLAAVLEEEDVHVTKGARSATFTRSKKDELPSKSDYLKYACGLISEYISPNLSEDLHKHLNLEMNTSDSDIVEPPSKRAKLEKGEPTEDYSDKREAKSKPQLKKLTNVQKKLDKADKSGMKSISSFFARMKR